MRVYGTAFFDKKQLSEHLRLLDGPLELLPPTDEGVDALGALALEVVQHEPNDTSGQATPLAPGEHAAIAMGGAFPFFVRLALGPPDDLGRAFGTVSACNKSPVRSPSRSRA